MEQRLLPDLGRRLGGRPTSTVLSGPGQGRGWGWTWRGRLGGSRGLLPVLHQPDPVALLPLTLSLLPLLLLVQLLGPLGVGLTEILVLQTSLSTLLTCLSASDIALHLSATIREISPNVCPGFSSIVIFLTSALGYKHDYFRDVTHLDPHLNNM